MKDNLNKFNDDKMNKNTEPLCRFVEFNSQYLFRLYSFKDSYTSMKENSVVN